MKRLLFLVPVVFSVFSLDADEVVPAVYHPASANASVQIVDAAYGRKIRRHRRRVRRRIRRALR